MKEKKKCEQELCAHDITSSESFELPAEREAKSASGANTVNDPGHPGPLANFVWKWQVVMRAMSHMYYAAKLCDAPAAKDCMPFKRSCLIRGIYPTSPSATVKPAVIWSRYGRMYRKFYLYSSLAHFLITFSVQAPFTALVNVSEISGRAAVSWLWRSCS